jgi:hypothetical protein
MPPKKKKEDTDITAIISLMSSGAFNLLESTPHRSQFPKKMHLSASACNETADFVSFWAQEIHP